MPGGALTPAGADAPGGAVCNLVSGLRIFIRLCLITVVPGTIFHL